MLKEMEKVELAMVIRELIEERDNAEKDMLVAQRLFNEHTARFKSLQKAIYVLQEKDLSAKRTYEDWK